MFFCEIMILYFQTIDEQRVSDNFININQNEIIKEKIDYLSQCAKTQFLLNILQKVTFYWFLSFGEIRLECTFSVEQKVINIF